MSFLSSLFTMNKLELYGEELFKKQTNDHQLLTTHTDKAHHCNQSCARNCRKLMVNSFSNLHNTLPNNRDYEMPILIESKLNPNLQLSNQPKTSKFSNFNNLKTWLDKQDKQKSKYFDVYHPKDEKKSINGHDSSCNSLSSSQSSDGNRSDSSESSSADSVNSTSSTLSNDIKNFDLHISPVQFNMDKVNYVKTAGKAKIVIDKTIKHSKVIALNCDSDCSLQDGIDLLEVAVMNSDMTLEHPEIFIFDIHAEPKIIDLFKSVFEDSNIVKVMFDARLVLRILSRKYGVNHFTALFDIQLAYRVLLSKLTNRPLDAVKREKLLYVSWQCNGPMTNIEKSCLSAVHQFKNKSFWKTRPINFDIMYNAAYDVFVMLPHLFTNLIVIMERTFNEPDQQFFIKQSNDLINRNLVSRRFAFFHTKHQYLGEMHRQIELLIQSDVLHRNKQLAKWQNQLIDETYDPLADPFVYEEAFQDNLFSSKNSDLLMNQIDDIDTDSYNSYNSNEDLMNSNEGSSLYQDCTASDDSSTINYQDQLIECAEQQATINIDDKIDGHQSDECESGTQKKRPAICNQCKLVIRSNKLNELIENLQTKNNLNELLFAGLNKYCQCGIHVDSSYLDEEAKCMNLLVDQIIDLAECKEDYM